VGYTLRVRARATSVVVFLGLAALSAFVPARAAAEPFGFEPPWLGVLLEDVANAAGVKQVVPGAPAEKAGLMAGDRILALNDVPTPSSRALMDAIAAMRVGDEVAVKVARGDRELKLPATLQGRPDHRTLVQRMLLDRVAPEINLPAVAGSPVTSKELLGRVVLVEFFSVHCRFCPQTHRQLASFLNEQGGKGLRVLGISSDIRSELDTYLAGYRVGGARDGAGLSLGFPVLHDVNGATKTEYWAASFPTVVVIDREGYVRHVGFGAGRETEQAIAVAQRLLGESRSSPGTEQSRSGKRVGSSAR
jgi:membrane-associated protease RseP (regulator of RpoE activity)